MKPQARGQEPELRNTDPSHLLRSGSLGGWSATQVRLCNSRWVVGRVERSYIGARRNNLVALWSVPPCCAKFDAIETTSPRDRAVLVGERARRTVRTDEREADGFTCALFDGARAREVVEVRTRGRNGRSYTEGRKLIKPRRPCASEGIICIRPGPVR